MRLDLTLVHRLDQCRCESLGGVEIDVLASVYSVTKIYDVLDVELVDIREENILEELGLIGEKRLIIIPVPEV